MNIVLVNVLVLVIWSCKAHDYMSGDKIFNRQKLESLLQKYMKAIKKISEQFPNREIELQFEIDGGKEQFVAAPKKTKYLRVPAVLIPRPNTVTDVSTPSIMVATPMTIQTVNTVASTTTTKDPDQKLLSLGELKKIIDEYDKEAKKDGEEKQPSLKKELCLALGMKYGLKCDDSPTESTDVLRSVTISKNSNFQKILQVLKDGEVVQRNAFSENSKENLYWFKIKFPKK